MARKKKAGRDLLAYRPVEKGPGNWQSGRRPMVSNKIVLPNLAELPVGRRDGRP
jgi:hypothetical protein